MAEEELKGQSSQLFNQRTINTTKASPLVIEWVARLRRAGVNVSIRSFEKWARKQMIIAQEAARAKSKRTGIPHEAGHGTQGSFNSMSNLASQIKYGPEGNRTTKDKKTGKIIKLSTDHVRTKDMLDRVDADFRPEKAFAQYLNQVQGFDVSKFNLLESLPDELRTVVLHGRNFDSAEAAESWARLELLGQQHRTHLEEVNTGKSYVDKPKNPPPNGEILHVEEKVGSVPDELELKRQRRQLQQKYDQPEPTIGTTGRDGVLRLQVNKPRVRQVNKSRPILRRQAVSTAVEAAGGFSSGIYDSSEMVKMQEDAVNSRAPFSVMNGVIYDWPPIRLVD